MLLLTYLLLLRTHHAQRLGSVAHAGRHRLSFRLVRASPTGAQLCGKQGPYGPPARTHLPIGRGWPRLEAALSLIWRWRDGLKPDWPKPLGGCCPRRCAALPPGRALCRTRTGWSGVCDRLQVGLAKVHHEARCLINWTVYSIYGGIPRHCDSSESRMTHCAVSRVRERDE